MGLKRNLRQTRIEMAKPFFLSDIALQQHGLSAICRAQRLWVITINRRWPLLAGFATVIDNHSHIPIKIWNLPA